MIEFDYKLDYKNILNTIHRIGRGEQGVLLVRIAHK